MTTLRTTCEECGEELWGPDETFGLCVTCALEELAEGQRVEEIVKQIVEGEPDDCQEPECEG